MALTILAVLLLLGIAAGVPLVWMLLLKKIAKKNSGQSISWVWGPRFRDGGVTYSQHNGVRFNMGVDNPNEHHNGRYGRRHHSKQHAQTKPWMK